MSNVSEEKLKKVSVRYTISHDEYSDVLNCHFELPNGVTGHCQSSIDIEGFYGFQFADESKVLDILAKAEVTNAM